MRQSPVRTPHLVTAPATHTHTHKLSAVLRVFMGTEVAPETSFHTIYTERFTAVYVTHRFLEVVERTFAVEHSVSHFNPSSSFTARAVRLPTDVPRRRRFVFSVLFLFPPRFFLVPFRCQSSAIPALPLQLRPNAPRSARGPHWVLSRCCCSLCKDVNFLPNERAVRPRLSSGP